MVTRRTRKEASSWTRLLRATAPRSPSTGWAMVRLSSWWGGAMCDRALTGSTAEELAKQFTVLNYDRRGRGDSGDTGPYAVEREIEDIGALIVEAGGTASVYGHSSGAGLALHATAYGVPTDKLVLHEPPYNTDGEEEQRISREYSLDLEALLSEGRRGDAVELFFTTVGMPREMVGGMRQTPGGRSWRR
jgi:pimeloyl-ACP methyl ester carboxylesterase